MLSSGNSTSHARTVLCLQVVICIGLLAGCTADISEEDERYVAASMPMQFESFRMYEIAPETNGFTSASRVHFRQGCYAAIRDGRHVVSEWVVIPNESNQVFDLDVTRTTGGWAISSDRIGPSRPDSRNFRTRFMNCLNAIQSKYQAQPESIVQQIVRQRVTQDTACPCRTSHTSCAGPVTCGC